MFSVSTWSWVLSSSWYLGLAPCEHFRLGWPFGGWVTQWLNWHYGVISSRHFKRWMTDKAGNKSASWITAGPSGSFQMSLACGPVRQLGCEVKVTRLEKLKADSCFRLLFWNVAGQPKTTFWLTFGASPQWSLKDLHFHLLELNSEKQALPLGHISSLSSDWFKYVTNNMGVTGRREMWISKMVMTSLPRERGLGCWIQRVWVIIKANNSYGGADQYEQISEMHTMWLWSLLVYCTTAS